MRRCAKSGAAPESRGSERTMKARDAERRVRRFFCAWCGRMRGMRFGRGETVWLRRGAALTGRALVKG